MAETVPKTVMETVDAAGIPGGRVNVVATAPAPALGAGTAIGVWAEIDVPAKVPAGSSKKDWNSADVIVEPGDAALTLMM